MAKLTRRELAAHQAAIALIDSERPLTLAEIEQCFSDWHEGATSNQTEASAFFTPVDMASDMRLEMPNYGTFVDLCAGTGRLAYFAGGQASYPEFRPRYDRMICVERNPEYVRIGKRLFPDAEWICGDALDPAVIRQIGKVDVAFCNPPFGTTTKSEHAAPRYRGAEMDLKIMDLAATLAPSCWAIVPRDRAPWDYRGNRQASKRADAFTAATGLGVHRFASLDCNAYREGWRGVSPSVEIVGFGEEYEAERATVRTIHAAQPMPAPTKQYQQLALL
jgi:predicted RNA methylase